MEYPNLPQRQSQAYLGRKSYTGVSGMSLHQMTKADRERIAKRSEEILNQDSSLTLEKIGSRLSITAQHLSNIRKEFGCRPMKEIKERRV